MLLLTAAFWHGLSDDQFDLKCEGTRSERVGQVEPYRFGVRIDLKARQWCWDHCEMVFPITQVFPDRIVLQDEEVRTLRAHRVQKTEVSRVTGEFSGLAVETRPIASVWEINGKCVKAPFSGFPEAKF